MSERPKLTIKPGTGRDPRRARVRPGAPRTAQRADAAGTAPGTLPSRQTDRQRPERDTRRDPRQDTRQDPRRGPGPGRPDPRRADRPRFAPGPAAEERRGPPSGWGADALLSPEERARAGTSRAPSAGRERTPSRPPAPRRPEAPVRAPRNALRPDADGEGERLSKRLAREGAASRREADDWIDAGWVRVDGKMAVLGERVHPHHVITIDPAARRDQARQVTILYHKPIGIVSGQPEPGYEPAVAQIKADSRWSEDAAKTEFHVGQLRSLAPAGRLDIDSTGLLVLTQDGRVARKLIGEDSLVEKEYLVRVEPLEPEGVREDAIALLCHGLELDDRPLKPAKVSWANDDQLRFVLREGRKRQIRRMCEQVGFKVTGLKRVRIGSVSLGKLPLGQWRYLGTFEKF